MVTCVGSNVTRASLSRKLASASGGATRGRIDDVGLDAHDGRPDDDRHGTLLGPVARNYGPYHSLTHQTASEIAEPRANAQASRRGSRRLGSSVHKKMGARVGGAGVDWGNRHERTSIDGSCREGPALSLLELSESRVVPAGAKAFARPVVLCKADYSRILVGLVGTVRR
jgi:hypothetical protein